MWWNQRPINSVCPCNCLMVSSPYQKISTKIPGILCGSVVKCLTGNPGVLGSSCTGSYGFFVGVSLGKTLQSPSLILKKLRKGMNNVSCHHDMTEILLKKHQSINLQFHMLDISYSIMRPK